MNRAAFHTLSGRLIDLFLGHLFLLPSALLLLVIPIERRALKSHLLANSGFYVFLSVYYALLVVAVSMFYVLVRYLYSIIPILAIVSAVCLDAFFRSRISLFRNRLDVLFHAGLLILIIYFNVLLAEYSINANPPINEISATFSLIGVASTDDVVMADYPYFVPYILGAKAVQIPSEEAYLKTVIRDYNVTYVVYGVASRWYNMSNQSGLAVIRRGEDWTTYKVLR